MVLVLLFFILIVMVVLVLLFFVLIVMVVMVPVLLFLILVVIILGKDFLQNLLLQVSGSFDGIEDQLSVKLGDGCCDDGGVFVDRAEQFHTLVNLLSADLVGPAEDDGTRVSDLVVKELPKVFQINLALGSIDNCYGAVQMHLCVLRSVIDGAHDIRELADARGLDQDALGSIGLHDFLQGSAEITYQRAADTARVHLPDFNA